MSEDGVFITKEKFSDLVSRREFEMLQKEVKAISSEVQSMAKNVNRFVGTVDRQMEALVAAATHNIPEGTIPLATHRKIVNSLITAFSLVVVFSVGMIKITPALPALIQALGK